MRFPIFNLTRIYYINRTICDENTPLMELLGVCKLRIGENKKFGNVSNRKNQFRRKIRQV